MKLIPISSVLLTSALTILSLGVFSVDAATVGCERAGGIKCQKVKKPYSRTKVIVVPKNHRHYHAYRSPLLTALGVAIVLDAAGNAVTDTGNEVVVLGEGNEVKNVYEKDGVVYLIKELG
ncbi:hypothetical protein [Shewanella halifaxensis]|nr:hypothetical protein [Shewanella halifaxensis]